jgi:DNA-binding NtrC family response regulator
MFPFKRQYQHLESYLNARLGEQESDQNRQGGEKPLHYKEKTLLPFSKKFLIIEDDAAILQSIVNGLETEGYVAEGLTDPNKLHQVVSRLKPDVFVVDYYLPLKSGLQMRQELKHDLVFRKTGFVLMSAYPHIKKMADTLGVEYLEKPFQIEDLLKSARDAYEARDTIAQELTTEVRLKRRKPLPNRSLFWEIIELFKTVPE